MQLTPQVMAGFGRLQYSRPGALYRCKIRSFLLTQQNALWIEPASTERCVNGEWQDYPTTATIVIDLDDPIVEIGADPMTGVQRIAIGRHHHIYTLLPPLPPEPSPEVREQLAIALAKLLAQGIAYSQ